MVMIASFAVALGQSTPEVFAVIRRARLPESTTNPPTSSSASTNGPAVMAYPVTGTSVSPRRRNPPEKDVSTVVSPDQLVPSCHE